jgi:hypothetical protein
LSNTSRTLRVIYSGDSWNREAAATTPLIAAVKRSPGTITMSPQRTFTYFQDYTITATVSTSNLDGKPITFKVNNTTLGTSTVVNNVATINFYATPTTYPEGVYTFTGQFVEDFNYFGAIGSMSNVVERLDAVFVGKFYPFSDQPTRRDTILVPDLLDFTTASTVTASIGSLLPEFQDTSTATVYVKWTALLQFEPQNGIDYNDQILFLQDQPFVNGTSEISINLASLPRTGVTPGGVAEILSTPGNLQRKIYRIRAEVIGVDQVSYEVLPSYITYNLGGPPPFPFRYNFERVIFVSL